MSALKKIDAAILSITKRGKMLRVDAHACLLMIFDHYIEHGDMSRLEKFQLVVDQTFGRSALKALNTYIENFGLKSLKWDDGTKSFVHLKGVEKAWVSEEITVPATKHFPAFNGHPKDFPFFNCEQKKDASPFVMLDKFANLIKQAETEYEKSIKAGTPNLTLRAQIKVLKELHLERVKGEEEEDEAPSVAA